MRALIFDPFAGVSGDMILGALVDLGLDGDWLVRFVDTLGLGAVRVVVERARRREIACARVRFELPEEHAHRHLADVLAIIDGSTASAGVKARAAEAFRRLARAEAEVHGVDVERVHFHEVGALDAILDVLCACAGVEALGFERVYTRPVAVGRGWVEMAHGRFPVPAPATLKLLSGLPVRETSLEGECSTPTGAAVLASLVEAARPPEEFIVERTGFGAGTRDPADRPNCLRAIACELAEEEGSEPLYLVQSDIDDLSPEFVPTAQEALLESGALDVVHTAIGMKKGRPGLRLEALVPAHALDAVLSSLFRHTSTIGARYWPVQRSILARAEDVVEWRGQRLRRKLVRLPGGGRRSKIEYEDIVRAARALDVAPWQLRAALQREDVADEED